MRRIALLITVAAMLAVMLAVTAGPASAVALSNGKGGEKANLNATFGIYNAISNTTKHDECTIC